MLAAGRCAKPNGLRQPELEHDVSRRLGRLPADRRWPVASARRSPTPTSAATPGGPPRQNRGRQVFGDDDPIDQTIRIGPLLFKVLGVLRAKGQGRAGQEQDDFVLVPYTTAQRSSRAPRGLDDIMCSARRMPRSHSRRRTSSPDARSAHIERGPGRTTSTSARLTSDPDP